MATKLSQLSPSRPKVYNLKDNNELNNRTIVIKHIALHEGGEFGMFALINCIPLDKVGVPGEEIIITTGATDILNRLIPLVDTVNSGTQVEGTLSKIGRKWFID